MRSQANTARIFETSPMLMRLKELEVLEKVAAKANPQIVLGEKGLADRVMNLIQIVSRRRCDEGSRRRRLFLCRCSTARWKPPGVESTRMRFWVGVTDNGWFNVLSATRLVDAPSSRSPSRISFSRDRRREG